MAKTVFLTLWILVLGVLVANSQERSVSERLVPLTEPATALDYNGTAVLEGRLPVASLTGTPESPVSGIQMQIKNIGPNSYDYVSGVVSFYNASGVRCGEGLFEADVLAVNESIETDIPGIRVACSATSWRITATNLVPRNLSLPPSRSSRRTLTNFLIAIDGEEHPIQLEKPMVVNLGGKQRTIVIRESTP